MYVCFDLREQIIILLKVSMKLKQRKKFQISIEEEPYSPIKHEISQITTPHMRRAKTFSDINQPTPHPYTPQSIKKSDTIQNKINRISLKKVESLNNVYRSINFIPKGSEQKQGKLQNLNKSTNKLIFKHKRSKTIHKKQSRTKLQIGLTELVKCFKDIVAQLENIIRDIQEQYHNIIKSASNEFETIISRLTKQYQKINEQKINGLSSFQLKNLNLNLNQQSSERLQQFQVPALDLSKIVDDKQETQMTSESKYKQKKSLTERNTGRTFGFSIPMRTNRKFQGFTETLNKIKRLSFGGSILRL